MFRRLYCKISRFHFRSFVNSALASKQFPVDVFAARVALVPAVPLLAEDGKVAEVKVEEEDEGGQEGQGRV